jgi:hypothetical protein
MNKPTPWCGNPECPCATPTKWACREHKTWGEPGERWCIECGHDKGDHRYAAKHGGRVRPLLHKGGKP